MGNYDTEYNEGPPQLSVRASQHTDTYMNQRQNFKALTERQ